MLLKNLSLLSEEEKGMRIREAAQKALAYEPLVPSYLYRSPINLTLMDPALLGIGSPSNYPSLLD